MLDVAGEAMLLPMLPASCERLWIGEFERFLSGDQHLEPFDVRLENGRWLLEGGLKALVRLELLREAGERTIAARARRPAGKPELYVEHPSRQRAGTRDEGAAGRPA